MDKKKIQYFKSKLLEERKEIVESLEDIYRRQEEAEDKIDSQLSTYSNHPADKGTEIYMRSQDQGFIEDLRDVLEEIDQSLEDIENDKYGYCDNCDKMISEERLEIIPYAKTCLGCSDEEPEDYSGKIFETTDDERVGDEPSSSEEDMDYDVEDTLIDVMDDNIVANDPSYSTGDNMGIEDEREDFEIIEEIEDMPYQIDEVEDEEELKKKSDLEKENLI